MYTLTAFQHLVFGLFVFIDYASLRLAAVIWMEFTSHRVISIWQCGLMVTVCFPPVHVGLRLKLKVENNFSQNS